MESNGKIKVAIIGVGNCASSLVQGVEFYKNTSDEEHIPGLMHTNLGGYHIRDIEFNDTGLEVGHLSTLAGLIANGVGVSIVPGFTLFQFYRLGLSAVPIRDRGLERPLLMVKRRGQSLSVAAKALLEMIAENPPAHVLPAAKADEAKKTVPVRAPRGKPAAVRRA